MNLPYAEIIDFVLSRTVPSSDSTVLIATEYEKSVWDPYKATSRVISFIYDINIYPLLLHFAQGVDNRFQEDNYEC